jgi:hypothetical protein
MRLSPTFFRLRSLAAAAGLALLAFAPGCDDGVETNAENVTDVANSKVKNQSIGNCWIYATVGWAESLHLTHTGTELNLSESYVTYWHWFEEITGAKEQVKLGVLSANGEVETGGFFGIAVEIMLRYGVMDEGSFIPSEAEAQTSARQEQALAAINASLTSGKLKTEKARADKALVRAELDKAWKLTPEVSGKLDTAFGKSVFKTLYTTTKTLPAGIRYARSLAIGKAKIDGKTVKLTLADAIGKAKAADNPYQRVGPHAWTEVYYPKGQKSRREFQSRAQQALHQRLPVVMSWFVDFNAMGDDGAFRAAPETPGHQGGHMTVLEDYQADVPGFGTLEAGVLVTDPAALAAALDPAAKIEFFRVKNSWGTDLAPPDGSGEFRGYHDLYLPYLDGLITQCTEANGDPCGTKSSVYGMTSLVLPPSTFQTDGAGAEGCHDVCVAGTSMAASCGSCVEDVCAADSYCCNPAGGWDATCVSQVASVCGQACP